MSDITDFQELCHDYAGWRRNGILEKIDAVDCVQRHAELWGMIDAYCVDTIQAAIAEAFAPEEDLPSDYGSRLLMQWELDDRRDRWRWTGELPSAEPADIVEKRVYSTSQSTRDAFAFVVSTGDAERLAAWLRNHPDDAAALLETLEAA
ncbi:MULTISPECIES: hypothetical protein [Bradyrhizobium]|uniref:hypothetical protein n=1 Tax=Bradyrhizobium TaxID=374 RepID=UPI001EDBCE09|nr:hypothetical protein [Bradyrhizobium zhengyangense]MCG2639656.1 hypothetical protein [Bradyrhizobium zhengyangense]